MLAGIRIVELGSGLPVWHAGALLRALGADVTRVLPERELVVDEFDRPSHDILNRGKGSLRADLRDPAARSRLLDELRRSDALVSGVRPATARAWGLAADQLARDLPELVVVSVSAFGRDGPLSGVAGHDINATGATGTLAIEADAASGVGRVPYETPVADLATALFAVIGALAGLHGRAREPDAPPALDVSMADATLALLAAWQPAALGTAGHEPFESAWYAVYRSKDGVPMALGAWEAWQRDWLVAEALGPAPADADALAHGDVARMIASRDAADWVERATGAGVALTRVNVPREVLDDEQVTHNLRRGFRSDDPWRRLLLPLASATGAGDADLPASADLRAMLFDP